jgi:hypothetical protein
MKSSTTYLNWLRRLIVLGAVVAGTMALAAGAVARPPGTTSAGLTADGLRLQGTAQVYTQLELAKNAPTAQGMKADGMRLQGTAQVYKQIQPASVPDVFERYAATHPFGSGLSSVGVITPTSSTPIVRPHDAVDSARAAQALSVDQSSSGFDWGDYAIGIGSGTGLILILGIGLVVGRQRRHRPLTA